MNINQKQMDEINLVQLNIFKEFIKVCSKLDLKYYMIHGSLLGAVKYNRFCPFDDDIDVAMPRKDYEMLLRKGKKIIDEKYFIQSNISEKDYPLVFAKIRDNNTAFIQNAYKGLNINQGIYIDIFPIDFYPNNNFVGYIKRISERLLTSRISMKMNVVNQPFIKKMFSYCCCLAYPNWNLAIKKKNELYTDIPTNNKCIVYGGKPVEKGIPFDLFGKGEVLPFEDIKVSVPQKYDEYLKLIYGDYMNYSPMGKYMVSKDLVQISADVIDTKKSYKNYL